MTAALVVAAVVVVGCVVAWRSIGAPRAGVGPVPDGKVYLLHCPSRGVVKIGWTGKLTASRPRSLIAQMPPGSPAVLVAMWPGGLDVERALHSQFAGREAGMRDLPAHTEWFHGTPAEVVDAVRAMR